MSPRTSVLLALILVTLEVTLGTAQLFPFSSMKNFFDQQHSESTQQTTQSPPPVDDYRYQQERESPQPPSANSETKLSERTVVVTPKPKYIPQHAIREPEEDPNSPNVPSIGVTSEILRKMKVPKKPVTTTKPPGHSLLPEKLVPPPKASKPQSKPSFDEYFPHTTIVDTVQSISLTIPLESVKNRSKDGLVDYLIPPKFPSVYEDHMRGTPTSGVNKPTSGINKPTSGINKPTSGINKPTSGMNHPNTGINKPTSGMNHPNTGINKPMIVINKPNLGSSKPSTGIAKPNSGSNKPTTGINKPNSGINQSNLIVIKPNFGINQPNLVINKPPSVVNKPNFGINKPNSGNNKPNSGINKPNSGHNKPSSGINQPITLSLVPMKMKKKMKNQMNGKHDSSIADSENRIRLKTREEVLTEAIDWQETKSSMTRPRRIRPLHPVEEQIAAETHFGLGGNHNGGERVEFQLHGQDGPESYKFGYDTGDAKNRHFRYEEKDPHGNVKGHYGYYDKSGKLQVVNYHADEGGFHASSS